MKFIGLDGKTTDIDIKPSDYPARNISDAQTAARKKIVEKYGNQTILEEFPIPKTDLRLDFFLPNINIAIEVHGEQHYKFVKHFHVNKKGFAAAKQRDEMKQKWCEINNIELVVWDA